jgi:hypothetical protein
MFTSAQYRQMAEEAARLAEAATNDDNRVIWLKIAEGYQILAERAGELRSTEGPGLAPDHDETLD